MTIFSQNDKGILQWYYIGGLSDKLRGITVLSLFILLLGAKVSMAVPANDPNSNCGCTARSEGHPSALSPGKLIHCNDIMKGFEEGQGRVKVIVNLAEPAETKAKTDWHSKHSLKLLQDEIKATQVPVLSALSEGEFKLRYRFDNQAGFSGEVTLQGLEKLKNDPRVISVEPVYLLEPHLRQGIPLMHADTYRSSYNGAGVAIAICDTGIDYRHPMLGNGGFPNSKVIGGYDYGDMDADPMPDSTQAHGTCCAGIAAGDLGDVVDYIGGVAYNAKLYALKITAGPSGSAELDAMVAAWDWCVTHRNDDPCHPILAISTSFGGGRNYSTCDSYYSSMTIAANDAVAAGITVLASSGNDGYCDSIAWPACISSVISVGAVYDASFGQYLPCISGQSCATKYSTPGCSTGYYAIDITAADMVTSYSNTASFLTVLAPSNQCYTTDIISTGGYSSGDYYSTFGGTSAACPYTAGAVACLQSAAKAIRGSYLSPSEVRTILTSTGDNITDGKVAITKPRVNLAWAIDYIFYGRPPTANDINVTTLLNTAITITLGATDEGLPNPPGVLSYIITSLPSHGTLSDPNGGGIGAVPYTLIGGGNQVIYTPATGYIGLDNFIFKANDGGVPPYGGDSNLANVSVSVIPQWPTVFLTEGFESAFVNGAPVGWTKSFKTGTVNWKRNVGDSSSGDAAHSGTYNALLYKANISSHETYLITPAINFVSGTQDATLEFWHKQALWDSDQDTLKVYYKTSAGGSWTQLASYTTDVSAWTKRTIALPSPSSNYYIGFLGNAKWGYGVCIDDVKVTGIVAPPLRTLTISSTLGGHTEPNAGTHQYSDGTIVGISAIPDPNYHFVNWTGTAVTAGKVADPNSATTTVLMDANYTVQANFTIDQRTLTTSTTAGGTVTTPGIGTYWYIHGTDANIVATADLNYHFVNWTGDTNTVADSNAAVTTITMDANYAIQANFSINQYPVTATSGPNGSIDPQGTIIVNYGDNLCFTAAPNTCYEVNEWYLDGNNVQTGGNYCLNSITANHTVYVTFKTPAFTVTASSDANGSVQPSSVVVNCGESQDFNAIPNISYEVNEWFLDGNSIQAGGTTYTLPSVTANHTVYVTFGRIPFTVNASADANGGIKPTGEVTVYYGNDKQFTATANPGYQVAEWFVDGNSVQNGGATYTLEDVTADHTVYVTFKELIFVISGYVLEQDGNTPVEGVPIQTDDNDINSVTDANGYYELLVDYNWSGIVTPQKEGYVFEPNGNTYTNVIEDYSDQNYIATLMTFKIAGYVLEQNYATPINDVNVSAENGGGPWTSRYGGGSWLTDANGYYEVVVDYNWSGKVVPAKYAYAFEPNKMEYVNVKSDSNDQDYIGTLLTFIISGHIKNSCDVPIAGVSVDANNGGGQNTTDVNGFYEVWVDYNWSGTVTPGKAHYTFDPNSNAYAYVLDDVIDQNYTAANIYDLDCDGTIGYGDLAVIAENWLKTPANINEGDLNNDNIVDFLDFAEFAKHWLEGPIL
jgi:subtilisin family serine protease